MKDLTKQGKLKVQRKIDQWSHAELTLDDDKNRYYYDTINDEDVILYEANLDDFSLQLEV